ncbi:hypothetical protein IW261DRAFT_1583620 [Armillaria novae-zelandiae]|uniref:Uncharacterized protein n=1 Tax=Armillaria novae-zelandiae TaxID=153914 RepID=A0AA39PCA1_9AGAR|nr:hypothetical protein IW261DRAFT_1583620 [Armillaria novae-zelandiae]
MLSYLVTSLLCMTRVLEVCLASSDSKSMLHSKIGVWNVLVRVHTRVLDLLVLQTVHGLVLFLLSICLWQLFWYHGTQEPDATRELLLAVTRTIMASQRIINRLRAKNTLATTHL